MRQTRAARTRRCLIEATAAEFGRRGFAGTNLTHITGAAGLTSGALMFHFPSKRALAAAVHACGSEVIRRGVDRITDGTPSALQAVVDITHAVALLLHTDTTVRASYRLDGELHGGLDGGLDDEHRWFGTWVPTLRGLCVRAQGSGELRAGTSPDAVAVVAVGLVTVQTAPAAVLPRRAEDEPLPLAQVWEAVLTGVCPAGVGDTIQAAGTGRGGGSAPPGP